MDRSQVNNGEQRKFPPEKGYEKEDLTQPLEGCDKMGTDDFGMIKPWVGSKRTGLRKKSNPEHETQHPNKAIKNMRLKGCLSSQGDKFIKRSRDLSSPISSDENPLLSSETRERKENLSCNSHDEYMELPRLRKRQGFSLSESRDFHGKKNHMVREHYTHSPNGIENHTSSQSSKKKRISTGSTVNAHRSLISTRGKEFTPLKETSLDRAILSEGKKFSSSRKNLLSESKKNLGRKQLDLKKRKLHYMSESDEEAVVSRSANDGLSKNAVQKEASGKSSINKCRVLKIRKKSGFFVKMAKEGEMALKGSVKSREFENHGVGKNVDSLEGKNVQDAIKEVEIHEKIVCEPTTNVPDGEAFVDLSKSLNPEFAVLGAEREMFCGDKVGEELVTSNAHLIAEINANEGQGDYFVDVDPIPIPGPPGSFLPSPGRMGSEELQGNSSLTTCRIHSSEDDHELVDMDSSDSPISATSVVSNSVQTQRGISEDRIDLVAENSIRFEGKQKVDEPRANSFFSETSPLGLKNSQPCCCSRKEGVLQSGEESQLLRRRTMTSLPSIAKMGDDPMKKLYDYNLSSETLPEKEQTPEPKKVVANSTTGYCESPSPSTPNPILRLMGKNLMVVNRDENMSPPQIWPTRSNMVNDYPNLRSCIDNGVSSGNIQKGYSFHHTSSRGPPVYDDMQTCIPGQHFSFSSIQDNFGRNFTSSVECHEFGGGPGLTRDQLGSKMRQDNHVTYEGEKTRTPPMKEIIVIDDSPEDENMEAGVSRDGISGSMVLGYDTRRVINPIYSYPTRYYPITSGSQMVRNANIQMLPPSKGGIDAKWNCTGEGSRTPHPNSLTSSTGHPRSSLYFSHGFP
ncbi:hypothetical protein BUALT_Bualt18G0080300 [Buddleja alternifolia]|uniref:Uncharacterized protein n=1 Tax=Buddleja alternifolia TaxID=168488 RepID=A0AAV6WBB3_9LAMI|nr:hypothetical protein BUALT_Bualt18G0080300 [Buddleja alternifolia]